MEEKILNTFPLRGGISSKQTDSFKEWCLLIQEKTGNKQVWAKKYKAIWDGFIEEFGVEVMIGIVIGLEFTNAEYAIKALNSLKRLEREDRLIREVMARERYWERRKALERVEGLAEPRGESSWDPERELRHLQKEHGLRSPEAVKHAQKWGLVIT